jgi:COMPASS component SPP1
LKEKRNDSVKINNKMSKGTKIKLTNKTNCKNESLPTTTTTTTSTKRTTSTDSKNQLIIRRLSSTDSELPLPVQPPLPPLQCIGEGCTKEAMNQSKYCSYECGMTLAKNRIITFLQSRIAQYKESPSLSDQMNEAEIKRIFCHIDQLKESLVRLEEKHEYLNRICERAKYAKIDENVEKERESYNCESNESEIYCVTCGHVCSERHALKHMERCFNKIESQAFFGSFYKTHIEGQSMFCDNYNAQTKMFCKRLKVMCPEHEKEKKVKYFFSFFFLVFR